jgi:acetyl esterase/lipase
MVFFFGGGWNGGTIQQFAPHAHHFSSKGLICILADYRVKSRQGTTPFEALKDAKSAIRFIKKNAIQFHIDSQKIIASGGSAGGHLAAATALCESFNESSDDLNISCKPAALVLFNPVLDNGPGGYGFDRVGEAYREFSPLHNLAAGAPPTILFLGSEDPLIPVETLKYYKKVMEKVGSRCDLHIYQDQKHGFFNFGKEPFYSLTVAAAEDFLMSLGFISKNQNGANQQLEK